MQTLQRSKLIELNSGGVEIFEQMLENVVLNTCDKHGMVHGMVLKSFLTTIKHNII